MWLYGRIQYINILYTTIYNNKLNINLQRLYSLNNSLYGGFNKVLN